MVKLHELLETAHPHQRIALFDGKIMIDCTYPKYIKGQLDKKELNRNVQEVAVYAIDGYVQKHILCVTI